MTARKPVNVAASVRQRLLNLSKKSGQDFNLAWTHYALERMLYRLSKSTHVDEFILKGAMLFAVWTGHLLRPTRDLDLLGYGNTSPSRLHTVFGELCEVGVEPDGLLYDPDSIRVNEIRGAQEYGGLRVQLEARLGNARIPLQIDVGFGDAITPKAEIVNYPVLLDMPVPRVQAYSRETVVAEKLEAMVVLGMLNSRMKDFYDLYQIGKLFTFESQVLGTSIRATFERRQTGIPANVPVALTEEFATDKQKLEQWRAFLHRTGIEDAPSELSKAIVFLREFLTIPLHVAMPKSETKHHWQKGGPWKEAK